MHMQSACHPAGQLRRAHSSGIVPRVLSHRRSCIETVLAKCLGTMDVTDVSQLPGAVIKAPTDSRHYHAFSLKNGATFVVVQDTEAVFAAAAVNMQAGYMDDPQHVPGLAHFLEHMVHLGSDKYPEEQQYKAYLAQHGGTSNASTGMVHTVYHFTVHHNALEGALDRLAQFFTSPLLLPESAGREVENVHAEFSRNCNSDARKILQLKRSLCRGPYSQFSTGNVTTLRDTPAAQGICVSQLLREFWEQHYTADRMCGCVVGPQPVDQLEAWVTAAFQDVRPAHPHAVNHSSASQTSTDLAASAASGKHLAAEGTAGLQYDAVDNMQIQTELQLSGAEEGGETDMTMEVTPMMSDNEAAQQDHLSTNLQTQNTVTAKQQRGGMGMAVVGIADTAVAEAIRQAQNRGMSERRVGYALDVARPNMELGCLVRVSPQREAMRTLELSWHIPYSSMQHMRCKPWRWVGHLLGHEGPGSLAAALKQAGLATELQSGMGDELRLQPGFMFWGLTMQLTEEGLEHVPQIILAVHAALAVLLVMPEEDRRAIYDEAAQVAKLRWSYADRSQAVDLARDLAHRSHYWEASHVLTGPALLQEWDGGAVQQFLQQLRPSQLMVVIAAKDAAGQHAATEQWYGAKYTREALPESLVTACEAALHSPPSNTSNSADGVPSKTIHVTLPALSLPRPPVHTPSSRDQSGHATELHSNVTAEAAGGPTGQQGPSAEQVTNSSNGLSNAVCESAGALQLLPLHPPAPNWALPVQTSMKQAEGAALSAGQPRPTCPTPQRVLDTPGVVIWHLQDVSWGLPKAHIHLHLITPCVYTSPDTWVTARLLVRLLDDLIQPHVYDAELVSTTYNFACSETGFSLHLQGFSSVLGQLLRRVLEGINQLATDTSHVAKRHPIMAGKLMQQLQVWAHNNPLQHAEYAAEHALQVPHWHVNDTLAALQPSTHITSSITSSSGSQAASVGLQPTTRTTTSSNAGQPDTLQPTTRTTTNSNGGQSDMLYRPEVSAAAVSQLAATFKKQLLIEGLCYGNMTKSDAEAVSGMLQELLQPAGVPKPEQWPRMSVIKLQRPSRTASTATTAQVVMDQPVAAVAVPTAESPALPASTAATATTQAETSSAAGPQGAVASATATRTAPVNSASTSKSMPMEVESQPQPQQVRRLDVNSITGQGVEVQYVAVNPNPTNSNSALLYLCQVCDEHATENGAPSAATTTAAVCLELLVQMASKHCFHALRTTQRLGYVVSLSAHRLHGVLSLQVRIQSPDHAPSVIRERLQQWLVTYRQELAGTSEDHLLGFKASLHSRLEEPPRSLSEAASRCWHPIRNRTYAFDRRLRKLETLPGITLQHLLAFYDTYVMPLSGSLQDVKSGATDNALGHEVNAHPVQSAFNDAQGTLMDVQSTPGQVQGCNRTDGRDAGASQDQFLVAGTAASCTLCCEVWGSKAVRSVQAVPQQPVNAPHLVLVSDENLTEFQQSMGRYAARPVPHSGM